MLFTILPNSDGVATGAEAFATSVGSGFEGLVVSLPLRGNTVFGW